MMWLRDIVRFFNDRRRVQRRLRKAPSMTSDGFLFSGHRSYFDNRWEVSERRFVSELLPGMDLFINFGANHGYYICLAMKHGVRTLAFEPVPENCAIIAKNLQANGWEDGCSLFPVAVANRTGFAEIHGPARTNASLVKGFSSVSHLRSQNVPIHRIDDVIPPHIYQGKNTLILMDIEGSEEHALDGASALLDACPKPTWIIEIFPNSRHDGRSPAFRAFEIMFDAGYTAHMFKHNSELDRIAQEFLPGTGRDDDGCLFAGGNIVFFPEHF